MFESLVSRVGIAVLFLSSTASGQGLPSLQDHLVDGAFLGGSAVVAVDLDLDGRMDLAGAGYYADTVIWWRNLGHGNWERREIFTLGGAFALKAADLDGDGDVDLYGTSIHTTEYGEDTVWWFENRLELNANVPPAFEPHLVFAHPNQDPRSIHAGDFDGDGHVDLAVAFVYDSNIHLFLNTTGNGPSPLEPVVKVPVHDVNGVSFVYAEDLDQDGDVDLIAGTAWDWVGNNNFYWIPNRGQGQFGRRIPIAGGPSHNGAFTAAVADIDGDGWCDLVTSTYGAYGNTQLRWVRRLNQKGTEWSVPMVIDPNFTGTEGDQSLVAADLDGDGDQDLVGGASFTEPRLRAWLNRGNGRFDAWDIELGFNAHGVAVADLDGDGFPEIAAASWGACCYTGELRVWDWRQ